MAGCPKLHLGGINEHVQRRTREKKKNREQELVERISHLVKRREDVGLG